MLRSFFKTLGSFGVYLLAFFIPALGLVYWCNVNLFAPLDAGSKKEVMFLVKERWTASQIAEELEKAEIIRNPASITFVTKYKMTEQERENLRIPAGEYALSPGMKPEEVLQTLLSGRVVKHDVSIPAAATLDQVAQVMADSGLVTLEEAKSALRNRDTLAKLGVPAYIPEGFFFEGTYAFTRPDEPSQLVIKLFEASNRQLDEELPDWRTKASELGFPPYDILKIASLIEREAQKPEERGLISSLLHNRLRIGLPLQSEPALRYGNPSLEGQVITEEARQEPGPYNTFLNTGLPLTPICSPTTESVEAALKPQETDFLYMIADGEGGHDFSATLREHKKKLEASRKAILAE